MYEVTEYTLFFNTLAKAFYTMFLIEILFTTAVKVNLY